MRFAQFASVVRITSIATAAVLLFLPLPDQWSGGWRSRLLDFGHVPLFAALVIAWSAGNRSPWRTVVLAAVFAAAAEGVQSLVGRTPDWGDFVRGALGASAAAVCVQAWRGRRNRLRLIVAPVLVAALLAWPVLDSGPWLLDAHEGYRAFPILASFQTPREIRRWGWRQAQMERIADPADGGVWVGRIDFLPGSDPFPTAGMDPITRDFRGYASLLCSFEVVGDPLQLIVSVRGGPLDEGHTRHVQFSHRFEGGAHILKLALADLTNPPQGPPLDLGEIHTIQFYVIRPTELRTILIRRIWLEK